MRRLTRAPRPDWQEKVEALGFSFHTVDEQPYWNEAAAYEFSPDEIARLEKATNELHAMCLAAVERVIERREFARLAIPEAAHRAIERAWEDDPPAMYGRFDFAFDGGEPKMLEYNADTPTSLLEAAVVQWHWLQECEPQADQFNSIWEGLVEKWSELRAEGYLSSGKVHFGCMDVPEDIMTTAVLMDTAADAGLQVSLLAMNEIGWNPLDRLFVDREFEPIQTLFKLYPWEWLIGDEFGPLALRHYATMQWIEPIWKMILSNKGILAILWEMYPEHPNLLPAFFEQELPAGGGSGSHLFTDFVRKPFLGREGANVTIHAGGKELQNPGPYDGPAVLQGYAPLPVFESNHAVIGSWTIDGIARGIGVRESDGPITEDLARFVPHFFRPFANNLRSESQP